MQMIPKQYQPGIGLRPGGERPDLEPVIVTMYKALYESIAAHSRLGLNVVADVGHHDHYSEPLRILPQCAGILAGCPALLVGIKCPIGEIMKRRAETSYLSYAEDGTVPAPVLRWQEAVHIPGIYDMEIDTSTGSPADLARKINIRLNENNFTALSRLAGM